jgi:imidazole glycerol-phosphate synthase subunit HisH
MIAIINYNAGNTSSVLYALQRLGAEAYITQDVNEIRNATKVILPGVGHAGYAMESLNKLGIAKILPSLTQPVLGICLGMQLMCNFSDEGNTKCLGIFDATVKKFESHSLKIPHVGWNKVALEENILFHQFTNEGYAYFVHSYYIEKGNQTIATTNYTKEFSSAMQKNNFYACQFHPEKSGELGDAILKNFITL